MKIFVTGASGYIGNTLAHLLAEKGNIVHALIRNERTAEQLKHPNIKIFKGDILDITTLMPAIDGCEQVYHVAGSANLWTNPGDLVAINSTGTNNILSASYSAGVSKLVYTSSGAVMGPSFNTPLREEDPRLTSFDMEYELSKKLAEDLVLDYVSKGMNAVIVRPTKVFGPGNTLFSYTANNIIKSYLKKNIVVIPGPKNYKANFSFIDDIVEGHLLAMKHGKAGEKYLLGGENISYYEFFNTIRRWNNGKGIILQAGKYVFFGCAVAQELWKKISKRKPLITMKVARYLFNNYEYSSDKASNSLGYSITSFEKAMRITVGHFKNTNYA